MEQLAQKYYTVEEYLALEDRAEYKSEYFQGEILAMTGASWNHNLINFNLAGLLHTALRGGTCQGVSNDLKLWIEAARLYVYPDLMIVCGEPEFVLGRKDTIANPTVIIEVLSPSTREVDKTLKLRYYKKLKSVQNYVMIEQDSVYVQNYQRWENQGWGFMDYDELSQSLDIAALNLSLPLEAIYERVELTKTVVRLAEDETLAPE